MDEYTKNKELFLAQKLAEKDAYLNGVRDALERLPANPSEFSRYLTIQGRLPDYSVGNALSIVRYCPDARVVRLYANWEKLGYKPKVGMKGIPVLVPGTEYTRPDGTHGRHYDLRKAFDISHLQGSPALPLRTGCPVRPVEQFYFHPGAAADSVSVSCAGQRNLCRRPYDAGGRDLRGCTSEGYLHCLDALLPL